MRERVARLDIVKAKFPSTNASIPEILRNNASPVAPEHTHEEDDKLSLILIDFAFNSERMSASLCVRVNLPIELPSDARTLSQMKVGGNQGDEWKRTSFPGRLLRVAGGKRYT